MSQKCDNGSCMLKDSITGMCDKAETCYTWWGLYCDKKDKRIAELETENKQLNDHIQNMLKDKKGKMKLDELLKCSLGK